MNLNLLVEYEASLEEIIDWMKDMTHDEIFQFIKALDDCVSDNEFTKKCYEYFRSVLIEEGELDN